MATIRIPDRPQDFIVEEKDCGRWTAYIGEHYRAYLNNLGELPRCAGRQCEFLRQGYCNIELLGHKCVWPYFWRKIDKDGNVLDRDGRIIYTKEESDKMESYYKHKDRRL